MTPRGLRHVTARLLVPSGAKVKVVQRQLGHTSAAMTLGTYTDLFDQDLDEVADSVERRDAGASHCRQTVKSYGPYRP